MTDVRTSGWTRIRTPNGRYEYQFQGRTPAVRKGKYEEAADYLFLVLDEEGLLYRIPVRISTEAESIFEQRADSAASDHAAAMRAAAAQLRAGLATFQPRQNAPYEELDAVFAVDEAKAQELVKESK
jgi:hypothetical protein